MSENATKPPIGLEQRPALNHVGYDEFAGIMIQIKDGEWKVLH
jgi:hypothetical protein